MKKALLLSLSLLAVHLLARRADAQEATGFALDRFDPSERGSDWFSQESLDLRGARPALGVVGDYAHDPLVIYNADGTEKAAIVSDQFFVHAGVDYTFAERVRVGVNLPVLLYQTGDGGVSQGRVFGVPDAQEIGDLRLGVDVRLVGAYGDPITIAAGLAAYAPTGSRSAFTGDGTFRLRPRLLAAGQIDLFEYAAQAAFEYRPEDASFGGSGLGSTMSFGAAAGVRLADGHVVLGPEVFGTTVVTGSEGAFQGPDTSFEGIAGGHFQAGDWRLGAGAGPGLSRGYGAPDVRALASIEYAPPVATDRDHDGIPDAEDACPDVSGIATTDPRTNGCPPDRDRDGVWDSEDACPDVPGVRSSDPKKNGCPPDRDSDGVPDDVDACPDVPGVVSPDPKKNGCPADRDNDGVPDAVDACPDIPGVRTDDPRTNGCPPDRDGDGVPDAEDACPDVPGVRSPDPKKNGCPSDRDNDGIPDAQDACPDVPGPPNPDPKKNGCPLAFVEAKQIKITEQVKFRFNSSVLDPAGDPLLNAVAKILTDHPEIKKLSVEGHTDNVGGKAYNQILSEARARAVLVWLTKHGIDPKRLESHGFGLDRPIADNSTEDGRRENRRVEFHIVEEDKPQAQP